MKNSTHVLAYEKTISKFSMKFYQNTTKKIKKNEKDKLSDHNRDF